jgi:hypothetical protein
MSAIDEKTLVLNRSRVPIHIKSVKDALCDVMSEVALFVEYDYTVDGQSDVEVRPDGRNNLNPYFMQTFTFAQWIEMTAEQLFEVECGDRSPITVINAKVPVKVPYVILLTDYQRSTRHGHQANPPEPDAARQQQVPILRQEVEERRGYAGSRQPAIKAGRYVLDEHRHLLFPM